MKIPSKTYALLFSALFAMSLTACGGDDKPAPKAQTAEPAKADIKTDTPAEPTSTPSEPTAKPSEQPPKTDDKPTDKPDEKLADKADEPATPSQDAPPVKALSVAEGKARYEKTCKVCHEQGLLNAPKLTAKADWAKRLEKGVDILHRHSAKGFGKMPAQVTADISEAEVYAAVDYMISQVK
ncbi:MAG: c-type cytochrome [Moraxella sp.]|nr:c-type cytochrome [Moraxella sp.]